MMVCELQQETAIDNHLHQLKECIIKGWPQNKDNIAQNLRPYWWFWDDMAAIDGIILKGRHIVIPDILQKQVLEQLHINHMGMKKTKLFVHKSKYWLGINNYIEKYIKYCSTCLEFQWMQLKEWIMHSVIPGKPWEVIGAENIFAL